MEIRTTTRGACLWGTLTAFPRVSRVNAFQGATGPRVSRGDSAPRSKGPHDCVTRGHRAPSSKGPQRATFQGVTGPYLLRGRTFQEATGLHVRTFQEATGLHVPRGHRVPRSKEPHDPRLSQGRIASVMVANISKGEELSDTVR